MFTIDGEMAQRRRFIKNKLEHEKRMLAEIEESMQTSDELTKNMSEILESFSGQGYKKSCEFKSFRTKILEKYWQKLSKMQYCNSRKPQSTCLLLLTQ